MPVRGQQVGDRAGPVDVLDRPGDAVPGNGVHAVDQRLVATRAEPLQPDHRAVRAQVERLALAVGGLVLGHRQHQRAGLEAERVEHAGGRLEPGDGPLDVQGAERGQEPAPAPLDEDEAVLLQQLECFPGGAAAHPAQLGDLRLAGHPVARTQVAGAEQLDELITYPRRHRPTVWHPVILVRRGQRSTGSRSLGRSGAGPAGRLAPGRPSGRPASAGLRRPPPGGTPRSAPGRPRGPHRPAGPGRAGTRPAATATATQIPAAIGSQNPAPVGYGITLRKMV